MASGVLDIKQAQRGGAIRVVRITEGARGTAVPSAGQSASAAAAGQRSIADADTWASDWKVLVVDDMGRNVLSPLLTVSALRGEGVTLLVPLHGKHEQIPDAAAVYLCMPSERSVAAIAADANAAKYKNLRVHFLQPVSDALLRQLAEACVAGGGAAAVSCVYDQPLCFMSPLQSVFHTATPGLFPLYTSPVRSADEAVVGRAFDAVAWSLFSAVEALGCLPVIATGRDGAAREIANRLESRLRQRLRSGRAPPTAGSSALASGGVGAAATGRPVVLIMDRGLDPAAALVHPTSYAALVGEVLGFSSAACNRVRLPASADAAAESLDLDEESDEFWRDTAWLPLPDAIEAHGERLRAVFEEERRVRAAAGPQAEAAGAAAASGGGGGGDGGSLSSAVDALPRILRTKKLLTQHGRLLQAVMAGVGARQIPVLVEAADAAVRGDHAAVRAVLRGEGGGDGEAPPGTLADRARLGALRVLVAGSHAGASASAGDAMAAEGRAMDRALEEVLADLQAGVAAGRTAPPEAAELTSHGMEGGAPFEPGAPERSSAGVGLLAGIEAGGGGGVAPTEAGEGAADLSSALASVLGLGAAGAAAAGVGEAEGGGRQSQAAAEAELAWCGAALRHLVRAAKERAVVIGGAEARGSLSALSGAHGAPAAAEQAGAAAAGGDSLGKAVAALTAGTTAMFQRAAASVKRLVQGDLLLPATRLAALVSGEDGGVAKAGALARQVVRIDPRSPAGSRAREGAAAFMGTEHSDVIVFVVGGGSLEEAGNLRSWASRAQPRRRVAYGATGLYTGDELLRQFARLQYE